MEIGARTSRLLTRSHPPRHFICGALPSDLAIPIFNRGPLLGKLTGHQNPLM